MFFPERIKSIKPEYNVLEIGPGSTPYLRSDIYLDKKFSDEEAFEQSGSLPRIKYSKPVYYYDGMTFPFQDKQFDYTVCSHVLEHISIEELPFFIKEIERVSDKGYIEVPRLFYEYLFNIRVHKWLINYKNEQLLFMEKEKTEFNNIQGCFYYMLKDGLHNKNNNLITDFLDFFMIGFEWEGNINYKINNKLEEILDKEDVKHYSEYFIKMNNKRGSNTKISRLYSTFKHILNIR